MGHWMLLLLLPLLSVPFVSEEIPLLMEFRLASEGMASLRGGILSLIRSKPLASSKLVILCWGENPLIAEEKKGKRGRKEQQQNKMGKKVNRDGGLGFSISLLINE